MHKLLTWVRERYLFGDEFQDAASKDGDWLIIGKFTESVEWSNRNYSAILATLQITSYVDSRNSS
jgi:hypothetical protein